VPTSSCFGSFRPAGLAIAALALLLLLMPAAGCSGSTSDRDVELLGVGAAREAVAGRARVLSAARRGVWLDPRTTSDWLTERIPGALHVPMAAIRDRGEELRGYDVVVVYGRGFKDAVAYAAAKILVEIGVSEVRVLEGGLTAWKNSDLPVASGSPMPDEAAPSVD
jgi:rhodanese-related sulfurtransferase